MEESNKQALSKEENTKKSLAQASTADSNEQHQHTDRNICINEEKKTENNIQRKKLTFFEKIAQLSKENPDTIILSLDRNLGIDMFNIPDEVSESQLTSMTMLSDENGIESPVGFITNPTCLSGKRYFKLF